MSQEKNKRQQALALYLEREGKISPTEIAHLLDSPPGTVRGWKSKDKWGEKLNGALQEKKRNAPNMERSGKAGAPLGNHNAKGNKGGSPAKNNKNAIKTGEYETILTDTLTEEEQGFYLNAEIEPFFILSEELRILKVRQYRMMKRIQKIEEGLTDKEITNLYQLREEKKTIKQGEKQLVIKRPELVLTEIKETTKQKLTDILNIEEALTRISGQITRVVYQLNKLNEEQNEHNQKPVVIMDDIPIVLNDRKIAEPIDEKEKTAKD